MFYVFYVLLYVFYVFYEVGHVFSLTFKSHLLLIKILVLLNRNRKCKNEVIKIDLMKIEQLFMDKKAPKGRTLNRFELHVRNTIPRGWVRSANLAKVNF